MGLLRFLLALSIVIIHSTPIFGLKLVSAEYAVRVFFLFSGFYMALVLNEKYLTSYKTFIVSRALKLFPWYWLMLSLTIIASLLGYLLSSGQNALMLQPLFSYLSFGHFNLFSALSAIFTNIFIIGQDLLLYVGINPQNGAFFLTSNYNHTYPQVLYFQLIPQAWAISTELWFYLIAPFFVRKPKYLATGLVLSLILRTYLTNTGFSTDPWTYRFFPNEICTFLLGSLIYHLYLKIKNIKFNIWLLRLSFVVMLIFTIGYQWIPLTYAVKGSLYLLIIAGLIPLLFAFSKNSKFDRYLAELSYPMYISHLTLHSIIYSDWFPKLESRGTTLAILTIIFSVVVGKILFTELENFRQRLIIAKSRRVL